MANKEINIEEIMKEIKAEIEEKGYRRLEVDKDEIFRKQLAAYDFEAIEYNPILFEKLLMELESKKEVEAYRQLKSRPVIGPIIIFFKKVIRKSIKFYIEPIVESQNEVNDLTTQLLFQINAQSKYIRELEERIDVLELYMSQQRRR